MATASDAQNPMHNMSMSVGYSPKTPRTARKKIPPIAGYSGFVPGLNSGNKHGRTWRNIFLQPREDVDRLSSSEDFELTHQSLSKILTRDMETESTSRMGSQPSADSSDSARSRLPLHLPNDFVPKVQKFNKMPLAGYGGFVPGYVSQNLHGAPWKDLISPRPSPAPSREGSEPARLSTPRSRIETPRGTQDTKAAAPQPQPAARSPLPGRSQHGTPPRLGTPRLGTPRSVLLTPRSSAGTTSIRPASARDMLLAAQDMAKLGEKTLRFQVASRG